MATRAAIGYDSAHRFAVKLTILGSSPSFPNPGGASSGYLISEGESKILLEVGHAVASILPTVTDPRGLSAIVISHMHPDHFMDLIPLNYAYRFHYDRDAIPLYLPPGGVEILERIFDPLNISRDHFFSAFDVSEYSPDEVLQVGQASISFARTEHFIPAYAMRFEAVSGGILGYSSDTGYLRDVVTLMSNASLALIEATYLESIAGQNGHLTAACAGQVAREAGVERLLLTHYERSLGPQLAAEASAEWGCRAELAEQLQTYEV